MKRNYFLIGGLMIAAVLVATLVLYPHLPERVPTHWNIHDQVDHYSAKWTLLVLTPAIMVGFMALFAGLPWLSPRHFEVDPFRSTYLYIMLVVLALMGYIQSLLLWAGAGGFFHMGRAILGGICLLFALLGNVLGKVQRNFYIGIRTPWTIANERVWNSTHRLAAKSLVIAGLVGLLLTFAGGGYWAPLAVLGAGAIIPIFYSLAYYKRLERRGEV